MLTGLGMRIIFICSLQQTLSDYFVLSQYCEISKMLLSKRETGSGSSQHFCYAGSSFIWNVRVFLGQQCSHHDTFIPVLETNISI